MPRASLTITATRVNVTVQAASYSRPTPIRICRNPSMIYPVTGNPEGSLGRFNSPVPVEFCDWPVAVLTVTLGAECSILTIWASAEE